APTKRTSIVHPRFSAGVSKSNEIWQAGYDSSFLLSAPPRAIDLSIPPQLADLSLLIPSTISSLAGPFDRSPPASCLLPAAKNPRIQSYIAEQVRKARWSRSTLRRKAKPQPLLVRNVWSDRRVRVYTRIYARTGTFAARRGARGASGAGAARRRALSAVGPVPRKEALFHRARGSTVTC
ncbi:hypothetical protein ALC56_15295, partial [Trachymyrmex septentrionalis]